MRRLTAQKTALPFHSLWTAAFQGNTIGIMNHNLQRVSTSQCSGLCELNVKFN